MPTISEATGIDLEGLGYKPVDPSELRPVVTAPSSNQQPGLSPFLRCPLPPVWTSSPDSLRQFYQGGTYPQIRLFNPSNNNLANINVSETSTNTSGGGGGGGGGGGTTPSSSIKALQASITTPSISPNATFVSSIGLSKSFQLLNLSASNACRVQLYGTSLAQSSDSYRGLDVAPPAGSFQNIICDIVLDTSPYQWTFQDRVGANGDSPQKSSIYITVTNLTSASAAIGFTITYGPIVNS